jgi:hypothetical protein
MLTNGTVSDVIWVCRVLIAVSSPVPTTRRQGRVGLVPTAFTHATGRVLCLGVFLCFAPLLYGCDGESHAPNIAPQPTAAPLVTQANTTGSSQVSPNDPDADETYTYAITTPPMNGTALVSATGVVTYTPAPGFTGTDTLVVMVTDNGTPPLSGTVTMMITVTQAPVIVSGTIQGATGPVTVGLLFHRSGDIPFNTNVRGTFDANGPWMLSAPPPPEGTIFVGPTICTNPAGQACSISSGLIPPLGSGTFENIAITCSVASPCEHAQFRCVRTIQECGGVFEIGQSQGRGLSCHVDGTPSPEFICCRFTLARDVSCFESQ